MTQEEWLDLITDKIKGSQYGYYVSWWLRIDIDIPCSKINYYLGKLVKQGKLISESHRYGIKYYLPTQPPTQ